MTSPADLPRRDDIRLLRGLCVLGVVAFHLQHPLLPSGHLGVDVFFVLSGYLIWTLLTRPTSNPLCAADFFVGRVLRLVPELLAMCAGLAVLLVTLRPASDWVGGLRDLGWGLLLVGEIHQARLPQGYFGSHATSIARHLWSLGVEWLWYLVAFPLALLARRSRTAGAAAVVVLVVVSAGWVLTASGAPADFFAPQMRLWELGLGALAVQLGRQECGSRVAPLFALLLVLGSFAAPLADSSVLPRLVVCTAAVWFLVAGTRVATGWQPLCRLGDVSYGVYLWHWPLMVLPTLFGMQRSWSSDAASVAAALVLGAAGQWLRPKHWSGTRQRRIWATGLALGSVLTASAMLWTADRPVQVSGSDTEVGDLQQATRRLPHRILQHHAGPAVTASGDFVAPDRVVPAMSDLYDAYPREMVERCMSAPGGPAVRCEYGRADASRTVVLFGDSHAAQWFETIRSVADQDGWRLVVLAHNGCSALELPRHVIGDVCWQWRKDAWRQIEELHPDVLLAASTTVDLEQARTSRSALVPAWQQGLESLAGASASAAGRTLFLMDTPRAATPPSSCLAANPAESCALPAATAVDAELRGLEKTTLASHGIELIDPVPLMCSSTSCPVVVANRQVLRDADHLTPDYAALWQPYLAWVLEGRPAS